MNASRHVASYYAATANPHASHPQLTADIDCDVCVVGAGFTGLSAALNLAERGYDVVVLEAERVGWGASGRNGGQINTGYSPGMAAARRLLGPDDAEHLWDMAEEAKTIIVDRVERHRIACDLTFGFLYAASKPAHMDDFRDEQRLMEEVYDYRKLRLLDRAEACAAMGTERFAGALSDSGAGHLHPLNYVLGLAEAAVAAGARIFEDSAVVGIETGTRPSARTERGQVRARHLILAGNAYLGGLAPRIRPRVMPVGTFILATEPMGEERARALIPGNEAICDSNFVLDYFRLSADHRMLFGGRVSYGGTEAPPSLADIMRKRMLRTYPQLADLRADYVWGGFVAITMNRLPDIGRLDGSVYYAQGFSGQGVALTGLAGKLLAEAVAGTAERFDVFGRIRHRPFPGGSLLRTPILVLATTWYRMRDLL